LLSAVFDEEDITLRTAVELEQPMILSRNEDGRDICVNNKYVTFFVTDGQ